jgi:hypothetical protein
MSTQEEEKKCQCYTCKYGWKDGECHSITMARLDKIAESQAESRASLDRIAARCDRIAESQAEMDTSLTWLKKSIAQLQPWRGSRNRHYINFPPKKKARLN